VSSGHGSIPLSTTRTRVGFLFEVAVIAVVLSGIKLVKDVPYTGSRRVDVVGAVLSVLAMGGIVLGILIW
jgi:hypothetical protein